MPDTSRLKNNISAIISLTEAELALFFSFLEPLSLKKNDFFLEEGKVCSYIGFVNSGVLIYYKSTDKGNEVTTDFAFENEWVTNNQSRLLQSPSLINIKAIEPTELLVIQHKNLSELYLSIPKIERLGRILMEYAYIRIARHSIDLQVFSAKERYEKLLERYPEILQRVSLYHIANYLGIAPKSLSRIRNEMFR